jgi:hypothetical protein
MWLAGTRAPTRCGRNPDNSRTSKKLPTLYAVPCGAREAQKAPSLEKILHQKLNKKEKQNAFAGQAPATETTAAEGSQCLIPWAMVGVIGLPHSLQDDIHHPRTSSAMRGSQGIPEIGDRLRSSKTLDTSLTRVTNQLASMTQSTLASRRSL